VENIRVLIGNALTSAAALRWFCHAKYIIMQKAHVCVLRRGRE